MLSNAKTKAANAEISSRHVHRGFNVFRHITSIMSYLAMLDLLHTVQIGIFDHLQRWIFHFMKTHKRLDNYNAIWLSMPAYHDLTPKIKSYEEVSQCNGKKMKQMSQCLLGVVTQPLRGGSPAQSPILNQTIDCTQALLELYIYARYKSHHDPILYYMEDALHRFHTFKEVF